MTAPANFVAVNGSGQISADNLNSCTQWTTNVASLRTFTGATSNMLVNLLGAVSPNDGGQGTFYWVATGTGTDDNGVTTVVPNGATQGYWYRQSSSSAYVYLTSNLTLYVATTGSDSNTGFSVATPFLTLQKAVNVAFGYNLNGYTITIQAADGTYTGGVVISRPIVNGFLQLQGDITTPANCIISTTSADAIAIYGNAYASVRGFKLQTAASGNGINAFANSTMVVNGSMNYGACANSHKSTSSGATILDSGNTHTISGNAPYHILCLDVSKNFFYNCTYTLTGTPAFSGAFCWVKTGEANFTGSTFSGAATGLKFNVISNGYIEDGGAGLNALPGSVAGTWSTGGVYGTTGANYGSGLNVQVLTSSGTYTPTSGMKYCVVEEVGAGGAGGGCVAGTASGSGGGAGEYRRGVFSAATIGASQTVTIGAGGTGISGSGGNAGGTTSFGALLSAAGGSGGGASSNALGGNGGTGGSGGVIGIQGQNGGVSINGSGLAQGGYGGNSYFGGGGKAQTLTSTGTAAGISASAYGAGGSGAVQISGSNAAGGNGSNGLIIITEYI